ncbi:NACHT domain-containing protein [Olleya namhaensis]|uniref:NACHT domain-containing protein n=1 Tax=Olleya namhaensis TaxID=1144750 RepID=A0A1I3PLG0_9FLAO|nr:NACHT domain-containing protein [Olleya namhaensis]SFJ22167.1 NACHT domain-containing protein [Olleya namhaensis]
MENIELYKDIYTIAKPFVDPLISTILKPKLESLSAWLKRKKVENDLVDNFFENKFEEYLYRTYQNCYYLNTIAFPNEKIKLNEIYYPTTLICSKDHKRYKVDTINLDFLKNNDRILVSDYAGMGKSTLSRYLVNRCISKNLGIPIFIELRQINKENTILEELFNQLNPIEKDLDKDFILKIITRGDFIVILDGFDEIPTINQEFVIKEVRKFISKASKNKFILTSRPEASLSSFGDFQNFFIEPLKKEDSFTIIDKYDNLSQIKIADNLKKDINDRISQIDEFLTNPFLVSLLYKSYTYNRDIPSKRVTFYDEVYTALFKAHDLSKDGYKRQKTSKLDIQDFRVILRDLAFNTAKKRLVEYSEQELISYINQSKENISGISFKTNDFLDDLLLTVPIIIRDGNKIKWAHKSIQDYFAAEFICFHQKKEKILNKIFSTQNEAFLNILILVQELDIKTFRKTILFKLIKNYINHYEKSYKKFKLEEHINNRKAMTFGLEICFLQLENQIEHNEGRKIVWRKYPSLDGVKFYSTFTYNTNFFTFFHIDFYRQLIELLYSVYPTIYYNAFKLSTQNPKTITLNKIGTPERLNDNPTNNLNSASNFKIVNNEIYNCLNPRWTNRNRQVLILDIDKCKAQMDLIEKEIKKDKEIDILDGI